MDNTYYEQYYDFERNHWWFKARFSILQQYILKNIYQGIPLKILNIGVATGATTQMLMTFGSVTSIEYEKSCIDFVEEKLPFEVQEGSILNLYFQDQYFDLVCAFDVIEHVEDDQLAVREMYRVCKPSGNCLITVPAFMHLWSEHDLINHHFRRYTYRGLNSILIDLNPIYISYYNMLLYPFILTARVISRIVHKSAHDNKLKSDFEKFTPGSFIDSILYKVFISESFWLSKRIKLPVGVSLIACFR